METTSHEGGARNCQNARDLSKKNVLIRYAMFPIMTQPATQPAEQIADAPAGALQGPLAAARQSAGLRGRCRPPGDKSISHRALLLNAMAVGRAQVTGLLEGEDVMAMATALRLLGAEVTRTPTGAPDGGPVWTIDGVGVQGFREPDSVLDMGNSGTAARLLAGAIAGADIFACMTGDASLRSRPMARVTGPLGRMGATFMTRAGGQLPMAMRGAADARALDYSSPVASAQVKSAILLAGLAAAGVTRVTEPVMSRDHTERMLIRMGAHIVSGPAVDGAGWAVALTGQPELTAIDVDVPADPSSAAFPLVAGLMTSGSEIRLEHVGLNPARAGLIATLQEMGGDIEIADARDAGGEPVADLIVRGSQLHGIDVPPDRAASMIDEYPVLAVAAAVATGETRMTGIGELRVKETDRITAMARGLAAAGVDVTELKDGMTVRGGKSIKGGVVVQAEQDHRIAMSFLVLSMAAEAPITVDDAAPIATSFPSFRALMEGLGAKFVVARP